MKKIILWLTTFVISFGMFACGGGESNSSSEAESTVTPTAVAGLEGETYGTVNAFDSQKDLNTIDLFGHLGRAELNADKKYIKQGEGSLKVIVDANPLKNGLPTIWQGLDQTPILRKSYTDFTEVTHVTVNVYNAQASKGAFAISLVTDKGQGEVKEQTTRTWYDLEPGWNKIVYKPVTQTIPFDGSGKKYVEIISFSFERDSEDTIYYMDDLKVYRSGTPVPETDDIRVFNEIASFDQAWQVLSVERFSWTREDVQPKVEQNVDLAYTSTGRGGSLKLTFPENTGNVTWPGVLLPEIFFTNRNLSSFSDDDYFCIDVYTPANAKAMDYLDIIFTGEDLQETRYYYAEQNKLTPGVWQTFKFSVKELRAGNSAAAAVANFDTTRWLYLGITSKTYETELYIDNIRIELAK